MSGNEDLMVSWLEAGSIQIPYLLMEKYRLLGLDEKELVLIQHILSFAEKGNEFPTPEQIAQRMSITNDECSSILRKLVQHEFIKIEDRKVEEVRFEKYSLTPLWYKLANELMKEKNQVNVEKVFTESKDLYTIFENEFGRPLSPMECESMAMWIDQDALDPSLIKAALREAVISGTLNFRYIDRILFEWKKNGIQTVDQAKEHSQRFRKRTTKQTYSPQQKANPVPFYNWLEQ